MQFFAVTQIIGKNFWSQTGNLLSWDIKFMLMDKERLYLPENMQIMATTK